MKPIIRACLYLIGITWLMLSPVWAIPDATTPPTTQLASANLASTNQLAVTNSDTAGVNLKPIIIIIVDKLDSQELFNTSLPGLRRLLSESGIGVMNIRTGAGYTQNYSGALTLGTGTRSIFPADIIPKTPNKDYFYFNNASDSFLDYLKWDSQTRASARKSQPAPLSHAPTVPEIDWIINQAEVKDYNYTAGLLGTLLHQNGWQTILLGSGFPYAPGSSPSALILMDDQGRIDQKISDQSLTDFSPNFPFTNHFSPAKVFKELEKQISTPLHPRFIAIEFSDFALLDQFQEQMAPAHYPFEKKGAWRRFNKFMTAVLNQWNTHELSLIVISGSISNDGFKNKNFLAPVIIRSLHYSPGLLASGTTKWPGLVANIDFLPTVLKIAGIKTSTPFNGRTLTPSSTSGKPLIKLKDLSTKVLHSFQTQRSLLDWYLGLISFGWILGLLCIYFKKSQLGNWLVTGVAVIPLSLLILPLIDLFPWSLIIFLLLVVFFSSSLNLIPDLELRFIILTGVTWGSLLIDQLSGWNLIRLSALGYNAGSGSRYYGMGNEYMGTFLATGLLLAYLLYHRYQWRWPVYLILGSSVLILGWPQFGANFGGLLAILPGLIFLVMKTGHIRIKNRRFWSILAGGVSFVILIGWWDSTRSPENQTHIGRFFQLIFTSNFSGIFEIILRKLEMNMKLVVNSPWTRIIGLTGLITIVNRIIFGKGFISKPYREHTIKNPNSLPGENFHAPLLGSELSRPVGMDDYSDVWYAILLSSLAAFLFNDSGVVACATCLGFAFSFFIAKWTPYEV